MPRPLISKILTQVADEPSRKEKIRILKENNQNEPLVTLLKLNFDPKLVFELPEGAPPFQENEMLRDTMDSGLYQELRKFPYFVKGRNNLKDFKREALFVEVLEMLHPDEASLLIDVKDKKLNYKGVTEKLVKEAFPGLL